MTEKVDSVVEEGKEKAEPVVTTEVAKELQIPKARLDEVISQRDEARASLEAAAQAQKDAEANALAEQGKYKELYEVQVKEAEKAQHAVTQMQEEALKRDVATKAGHPQMWDRIFGGSQNELEADMAKLVEAFPKAKAPNIDAGTGSGKRTAEQTEIEMTTEQKTYLAGVLGVSVEHLP